MVAALAAWHEQHAEAAGSLERVNALPAHALLETYSVLTRLPGGLAVPPLTAAGVLARRFPESPFALAPRERGGLLERLSAAGVSGGASYDGLVGLEAAAHEQPLLTLDERAQATYRALGVEFRPLRA